LPSEGPPSWLRATFVREYDVESRCPVVRRLAGELGRKYAGEVEYNMRTLMDNVRPLLSTDTLDVRHPLLYRPLVECALTLQPEWRSQPYSSKHMLRHAVWDVLPDVVRQRTGKGGIGARVTWAFAHESPTLALLTNNPILTQLNIVSARKLKQHVEAAQAGQARNLPALLTTLSLEMWLRVRSGQWQHGTGNAAATQSLVVHSL